MEFIFNDFQVWRLLKWSKTNTKALEKINNIYNKLNNNNIINQDITKTIIKKLGFVYFQRYQEFLITSIIKGGY